MVQRHWGFGGASGTSSCAQNIGGPQERERRGGTENVPGVVGLGVAARLAQTWLASSAPAECAKWQPAFERTMRAAIPDVVVHSECAQRLWNTSCLGFPGRPAEGLLLQLSEAGVACSAGSTVRLVPWNPCTRCLPLAWTKRWPVRVAASVWDEISRSMAKRQHARCSRSWLPPRFERS